MRLAIIISAALLVVQPAFAQEQKRLDFETRVSAAKSVAYLLDQVCLSSIVDDKPIEDALNNRDIKPASSGRANLKDGAAGDRSWIINGTAGAQVTAWADGTCMVGVRRGDSDEVLSRAVEILSARGFSKGQSQATDEGRGLQTIYCYERAPITFVAGVTVPAPNAKRAPFVANIFRSKSAAKPAYCTAG